MKQRFVYLVISTFILSLSASAFCQFASVPQGGIAPYLDYQHADIDSVNLSNGNVNLHIPLVSFPQLGSKLQLNFVIRFNSPKWVVNRLFSELDYATGKVHYTGQWDLQRDNLSSPTPVGADVVRDQGLTAVESYLTFMCVATDGSGPGDCDDGIPAWNSEALGPFNTSSDRFSIRDRSGAEHTIGQSGTEPTVGLISQFSTATDGSGWTPVAPSWGYAPAVYYDRSGLKYTNINAASGTGQNLWQSSDPQGNTITTTQTGWTDSVGRTIPGSWSGPGNGLTQVNSIAIPQAPMEDDPFPGIATSNIAGCNSGATAARVWQVPSMNGSTATYKFCYTPQQASTQFNVTTMNSSPAGVYEATATGLLLTQVILPNKTSYSFTYDNYFDLASVTLPTGGTIAYQWITIPWDPLSTAQPLVRAVKSRTVTAGTGSAPATWNYTWTAANEGVYVGEVAVTVNVTKPDGNDETHVSGFLATSSVKYYQGSSPANPNGQPGTLLRTESTTQQLLLTPFSEPLPPPYQTSSGPTGIVFNLYTSPWSFQDPAIGPPLSKTVTLENGTVSKTVYTPIMGTTQWINFGENTSHGFDSNAFSGTCQCVNYGLNAAVADYDFGATGSGTPGALLKTTSTSYKWHDGSNSAASYLAANLLDLPSSVTVAGAKNNSQTNYTYDETAYSTGGVMGNLTTVSRVNSLGASPSTHTVYNILGIPTGTIDANGNKATVSAFQCSGLFPQTVVSPYQSTTTVAETSSYVFDCDTGKVTSYTDPNSKTTSYIYTDPTGTLDPLSRLREIKSPDGGDFQINYNGDPAPPLVTLTTATGETGGPMVQTIKYDGLGRTTEVQLNSDPAGVVYSDTSYDSMGRKYSQSNPYRSTSDATYGLTKYTYDALGRMAIHTNPDGTTRQWCYDDFISVGQTNCYAQVSSGTGAWEDAADEKGNDHQETMDALGRFTSVAEPNGSTGAPSMITSYTYDVLNNLWGVAQSGIVGTDTPRTGRSFTYDNLSRLLCASNPENSTAPCPATASSAYTVGTTGYSYDLNGNLLAKTDARGVTTASNYDSLNRLLSVTYAGTNSAASAIAAATLPTTYTYDGSSVTNGIGRLATEYTGTASTPVSRTSVQAYDPMGRVKQETTLAPNASSTVLASYDLAGHRTSLTYPDGRLVQDGFDAAGRLNSAATTSFAGNSVTQTYVNPQQYAYDPAGHLTYADYGDGTQFFASYDNRERVTNLTYGPPGPLWSKQYAWTPNSNLQSQTDLVTGVQRQFSYDNLNRLTSAQDIFSSLAVSSSANGNTTSTSSSGSGAEETPGATGAIPEWTNPDDSNLLTDIGATNSTWIAASATVTPNSALAPDGSMTATTVMATSGATDTYVGDSPASAADYSLETMTGSVWLRSITGTETINLYLTASVPTYPGWQVAGSETVQLTTAWKQFSLRAIAQDNITALTWQIGGGSSVKSGQGFMMWNPMLEDSGIAGTSVTNYAPYSQRFTTWTSSQGTAADNTVVAPDGTTTAATLTASASASDNYVVDGLPNPAPFAGQTVTGSVWLKVPSGTSTVLVTLYEAAPSQNGTLVGTAVGAQTVNLTTSWQRFHVSGPVENPLTLLVFQIGGDDSFQNGKVIHAWGAQVELAAVPGPYVATADVPVTHGTTLTNLLPYSEQPAAASWGNNDVNVYPNAAVAPDGSMTAARIAPIGGALITDTAPNAALYDGATLTASVYLRSEGGTESVTLNMFSVSAGGLQVFSSQPVSLTSTWQRFQTTGTVATGLTGLGIQVAGPQPYQSGQVYDVWGAQMEVASQPGPYIETTALPIITGSDPTNILPSSQSISGASWGANGAVATNAVTAPDGTMTAAVFTGTNGSAGPPATGDNWVTAFVPNPSLYDSETVTASVYLRVASGTRNVNLALLNIGDQGPIYTQPFTAALTTDWQRFALKGTLENGLSSVSFIIGGANTIPYGAAIQIWGAQFTVGSDPGAYTPTTTTTTVYATDQAGTPVPNGLNQTYAYDSFGNIFQNGSFSTSYTANNQMFGYEYDAAGNLLSDGMNIMTWDAESRMSTAGGATYIYDAEGNRVEKQGSTVIDTIYFGGQPIARYSGGQWTDLIYGPNGLLAEVPGTQNGLPLYRATDYEGTIVGSLLANGTFVDPVDHTPFGQVFTGNTSDPYLFTGKERDAESGLDYFGARYYASNMGRWMSPDWADKPEDVPYADLENPQSLNLYGYVNNNPLSKADKDGHDGDDVLKLTAAAEVVAPELTPIILGTAAAVIIYQNQDAISDAISNTVQSTNDGVKKEWEKLWGTTWPKDPATGKNQDCCHIVPKADGGAHNVNNVEPLPHAEHVKQHKERGDFKRWGKRGGKKPTPPKPEPPKPDPPKPEPPPQPEPPKPSGS